MSDLNGSAVKRIFGAVLMIAFSVFSISFILRTYHLETITYDTLPQNTAVRENDVNEITYAPKITVEPNNVLEPIALSVKLDEPKDMLSPDEDKPRVLIYHTHTYEAYEQEYEGQYELANGAKWRSKDKEHNLLAVGEELKNALEVLGVEVVHDITEFEPPRLGTAYIRSLEMLESRLDAGEEYDLIIDMHRDAYSQRSWTPKSTVIDGEECARIMLLMGTGEAGFSEKPDWEENCKLAQSIIDELKRIHPDLAKDMNLKDQRYNQHVSTKSVLIEVGHNENTITQAKASMKYLALSIYRVLQQ